MSYKLSIVLLLIIFSGLTISSINNVNIHQLKEPSDKVFSSHRDITMASYKNKVADMIKQENKYIPNDEQKNKDSIELVDRAVDYLIEKNVEKACNDFVSYASWRRGEISIFILDEEGYFVCCADNASLTWKRIENTPNFAGVPIFKTIQKINSKGQWINYRWNNGFKAAFLRRVDINNTHYYIGAGYYPQSKKYIAEQLAKTAIQYFKEVSHDVAFTRISNQNDAFVIGDISMYVGDFEGTIYANSFDPGLARQNMLSYKDSKGNFIIKDIIKTLRRRNSAWISNYWKNSMQQNYIEKVIDKDGKPFFFVSTFIPSVNEVSAVDLIARAMKHIKKVGNQKAFEDFSSPIGNFHEGDISVVVYDFDGNNLANGEYPVLAGKNLLNRKDRNGKFLVQEIISKAKKDGWGFITAFDQNSGKKIFIKTMDTPEGRIIITVGVYIQSKYFTVEMMVEKALGFLSNNSMVEGLNLFSNTQSEFYFGDVYLFMYDSNGIALLNGEYKNLIWGDYIRDKDDNGEKIIPNLIDLAKKGGGWYIYSARNAQRRVYVRPIMMLNKETKEKELYILGSGYFV